MSLRSIKNEHLAGPAADAYCTSWLRSYDGRRLDLRLRRYRVVVQFLSAFSTQHAKQAGSSEPLALSVHLVWAPKFWGTDAVQALEYDHNPRSRTQIKWWLSASLRDQFDAAFYTIAKQEPAHMRELQLTSTHSHSQ